MGETVFSYIEQIEKVIEFIENHIKQPLPISNISKQFHISEFHFQRLFRALVGRSPKQYILGRKLTYILDELVTSERTVLDVALDYGFEYPEVMSRAFKKQFGISPNNYRKDKSEVARINKAEVVPRRLINHKGGFLLKADIKLLPQIELWGIKLSCNINDDHFEDKLVNAGDQFLKNVEKDLNFDQTELFSIITCAGDQSGLHHVYMGMRVANNLLAKDWNNRIISEGKFARFEYQGEMKDIHNTVSDDLYQWIATQNIEIRSCGIGMMIRHDETYKTNKILNIFIPIK